MTTKVVEYRERMAALLTELSPLKDKRDRTADEEARIDAILVEINDIGPKYRREQEIEAADQLRAHYTEPAKPNAGRLAPHGPATDRSAEDGGHHRADLARGLGRRFAASDEVKEWVKRGGAKSDPYGAGSFYHRRLPRLTGDDEWMDPRELRALIYTGALPADMVLPQIVAGIFRGVEAPLSMRDVLINGRTTSDAVTFMRELLFTNAAVEVAQATATSGASGLKPESGLTFEQATAPVVTIAHWIPITRQTIEDAPQLQTYVEQRLLTGLERREDNQILNGDGTGANMTGILNTSGIQLADTAHFTGTPVQNAGQTNENINRIRRGKRLVRVVGQATPNFIVLHPTTLETFETLTDANRQYLLGDPVSGAGIQRLWGMQVVESENIATNRALVGDGTMAAVWDRMDSRVMIDTINDQFVRNMLTLLAEERLALAVYRPAAFVNVTLV